jgi:hypothetical protein
MITDNSFFTMLRFLDGERYPESSPLKLGNVEFWFDGDDWCYDLPRKQWDTPAISADLSKVILEQSREVVAKAMGIVTEQVSNIPKVLH